MINVDLKKVNKSLKKNMKSLKLQSFRLNLLAKRLNKREISMIHDLAMPILKAVEHIDDAINEGEIVLKSIENFKTQDNVKTKNNSKYGLETTEMDIFEIKILSIKMNIKPETLIYILRSCFRKKRILLLIDEHLNYLRTPIKKFFDFIFEKSFFVNIIILTKKEFQENKDLFENSVILEGIRNIGKNSDEINLNDSKFEHDLIGEFYNDEEKISGLINLRERLEELYALSESIFNYCERQTLSSRDLINYLEEKFFIKVPKEYLDFLINVVRDYYEKEIKFSKDKLRITPYTITE